MDSQSQVRAHVSPSPELLERSIISQNCLLSHSILRLLNKNTDGRDSMTKTRKNDGKLCQISNMRTMICFGSTIHEVYIFCWPPSWQCRSVCDLLCTSKPLNVLSKLDWRSKIWAVTSLHLTLHRITYRRAYQFATFAGAVHCVHVDQRSILHGCTKVDFGLWHENRAPEKETYVKVVEIWGTLSA